MNVRPGTAADHSLIVDALTASWGGTVVVGHGVRYDASTLPALLAFDGATLAGLLTYNLGDRGLEVVTIDALVPQAGAGTALLSAAATVAREAGASRLWLVTTNDNLDALRFYQRRGLRLVAVHPGAVDRSRHLKPSIPLIGAHDIEIHDELELELSL
jgi:GNAT superfamily N-acetyltransferase